MSVFSPSDLGRWEAAYRALMEGERRSLTEAGTWMLADKPALVAAFDGDEVVYITATRNMAKTVQAFHRTGAVNEFRTFVAVLECGMSHRKVESRYKDGRGAQRVDNVVGRLSYTVAPAPAQHLDLLAEAFRAVADPRYNGPTSLGNMAIDALPK